MNIHILLNYIDFSRQATTNLHMHGPRFSLKLVVTCVINWQGGTKLIRHGEERDGFVTLNTAAIKKRYDGFITRDLGANFQTGLHFTCLQPKPASAAFRRTKMVPGKLQA